MKIKHLFAGICLLLGLSLNLQAADQTAEFWPGSQYQENIPTFQQVLGYEVGERITSHGDMLRYFRALEQAAPTRIKIFEYARTWENRQLIYAVVGEPKYLANLESLSADMRNYATPGATDAAARKVMVEEGHLPATVWLGYGVHGNEISSTDAAMMTAYHLLAAPQEAVNQQILSNTLVFIDPLQNPDGRERFTSRYYATVGLEHSDDRLSAEHNEPWPRGRSNHYLFDMNRDWLAQTQPETRGRIAAVNKHLPLAFIDLHEMGGDSSYYFSPAAKPFNPYLTKTQLDNIMQVGRNHGKHFDRFGFDYFTREVFDAFYPGYGDSWPQFYGAIASTYEVASSRGEKYRKSNGELYTYRDSVQRHFVASISTAEAVSNNRAKLLKDFYQYQLDAVKAGKNDKKERVFIIPTEGDRAGSHRLATLMAAHGVTVEQAQDQFKACGQEYPAGTYFIDIAQPRGRFVKTTFTQQVDMDKAFIKEQERRRDRKLRDQIYDVTGWSLPLMFNLDVDTCGKAIKVASRSISADHQLAAEVSNIDATVAYLVPWGDMSAGRFLTMSLRQGIKLKSADQAFTLDNKQQFPAGTLIIEKRANGESIANQVAEIARVSGAKVIGVDTSWVTDGPNFGSNNTVDMSAPRIAIAWDDPTSSLSAGNTRFVIERQFNYPVTAIRTRHLARADLSNYQVLILPQGSYQRALGESGAENLKQWVKQGGVLITLGNATRFAADSKAGLLDVDREQAYRDSKSAKKNANGDGKSRQVKGELYTNKADFISAIEDSKTSPDYVAGVLANVEVDQEHWLTAGVKPNVVTMVTGRDIYTPIKLSSGHNVAWFKAEDELLASGYLWQQNKQQLAFKPFLIHQPIGRGMVIGFTQEPTTRAYLDGLNVILMNTIFRGAAHARPVK